MKKKEFFLHIGYPKTGTTFLQKKVFSCAPEIKYLGKSQSFHQATEIDTIVDDLRLLSEKNFIKKFDDYLFRIRSVISFYPDSTKFIYSNEVLLNQLFCPNFSVTILLNRFLDILNKAEVEVKIVVTADRDIPDLILSLFSEAPHHFYKYHNKWNSFSRFKEIVLSNVPDEKTLLFLNSLDIGYIKKNINIHEDKFFILSFKKFREDFQEYIMELNDCLNINYQDLSKNYSHKVNSSIIKNGVYEPKKYQMTITEFMARITPGFVKNLLPYKFRKTFINFRNRNEKFFFGNDLMQALAKFLEKIFLKQEKSVITFNESEKGTLNKLFKNN